MQLVTLSESICEWVPSTLTFSFEWDYKYMIRCKYQPHVLENNKPFLPY